MGIKNPSGKPDKILGGYLRWTGFPCWGNAITRRRLVIQKWAITTGRCVLLGSKIQPRDREVNLFGINILPLGNLFIENGKKRR